MPGAIRACGASGADWHEWNSIAHLNDYEGIRKRVRSPARSCNGSSTTPTTRSSAPYGRKRGRVTAYRDATLFKVVYAWGLRRTEASRLDIVDWGRNPAAPELGRYGMLHVRYGKASVVNRRAGGTCPR